MTRWTAMAIVALMPVVAFGAGGDTLRYSTGVRTFADGDTLWTGVHYHPLKDSIQRTINGRLGNVNMAADANINPTKLDSSKTLYMRKIIPDSVWGGWRADTITTNKITSTKIDVDSIRSNPNVDSLSGNILFGGRATWTNAVLADSIESAPQIDSITGPTRVTTGRLTLDKALDADSLVGSVRTTGVITLEDTLKYEWAGVWEVPFFVPYTGAITAVSIDVAGTAVAATLAAATLNTGNGANELYGMNQSVKTTDAVTFRKLTVDTLTAADTVRVTGNMVANNFAQDAVRCKVIDLWRGADYSAPICTLTSAGVVNFKGSYCRLTGYGAAAVDTITFIDTVGHSIGEVVIAHPWDNANDIVYGNLNMQSTLDFGMWTLVDNDYGPAHNKQWMFMVGRAADKVDSTTLR